ncbi:hypothetical protein KAFR_0C04790 [Kazachstania africana CBS 2517]|uniref:Cell division control protein 50 n=1 Tax=Kazachstania africana (strain ATCC 22294 / BCRC 22015 / CBS 2517 / CECT 1963 / NBRC 1671 / NRRL Y-8276) TaxID=1071382 RepID=H2ASX0_KAZAF|nr:hypothetical protein KAFR_0C04790 [Kazachstania africana CBS 2517]CCF57470.1 hypothetical protein KAFR_0C04790 [Kazachstania africana CBS 2517]
MVLFQKSEGSTKRKSRKPLNTSFRQQRLRAWQINLSPQSVLPLLICIACIFAPIGVGLIVTVIGVQNMEIRYDQCLNLASTTSYQDIPSDALTFHFKKAMDTTPKWILTQSSNNDETINICRLQFQIPNDIDSSINIYYKLTNFYQNHREYVESYDIDQLKGKAVSKNSLDSNCDPLKVDNATGKLIYPCGLIANSMFNDTFSTKLTGKSGTSDYILTSNGTSWSTDRHRYSPTKYSSSDIVPPPNWAKLFPNGYNDTNIPNLKTWDEFQIWMRAAALPKFYKLALKNDTTHLPNGNYEFDITLNYPVDSFNGTKSIMLTTNTIIGAKNMILGIVFLIIAGICTLSSILFLINVIIKPREAASHSYLNYEPLYYQDEPFAQNPTRELL